MQQNLRKKTKFIYFKIINQCAKDGRTEDDYQHSISSAPEHDRRKEQGSIKLPPASNRSHSS